MGHPATTTTEKMTENQIHTHTYTHKQNIKIKENFGISVNKIWYTEIGS